MSLGIPAIFAVCERVREWLADNNVKGLDDGSMHAQMIRRAKEVEKIKLRAEQQFETQKKHEEMSEAELEEIAVRKRRSEGTPCNEENFIAWKKQFEEEMAQKEAESAAAMEKDKVGSGKKKGLGLKKDDTDLRLTGYEFFSGKVGILDLDAIEKEAEEIENKSNSITFDDINEELFDDDDDLDDLDFDDEVDEDDVDYVDN